jgi:hypothetical protein
VELGFEEGLHACKAGDLPLGPKLQTILLLVILEMGSHELFAWAELQPQSS